MAWIALKWLRPERREWWGRLSPPRHHLACLVLHEAIRAEAIVGSPVAAFTMDELVRMTGASRSTVARDLAGLLQAGICRVDSRRGRGSRLLIVIVDPDRESDPAGEFPGHIPGQLFGELISPESETIPPTSGLGQKSDGHIPGQLFGEIPGQFPDSGSHVLDQRSDLIPDSGSEISERPSTSGDLTSLSTTIVDPNSVSLEASGLVLTPQPAPKKRRAPKTPPVDRIPDRAWAAADYLRAQLVIEAPNCHAARQPWKPDSKFGTRARWADDFRLLHEVDKHDWDEIARVCSWLFKQPQPRDKWFVVESPDSLRQKWDRIQAVRRAPRPQPSQNNNRFGDNRPAPELKHWRDGWPGGDKS